MTVHPTSSFEEILHHIVGDDALHCRWVNTLSMMENIGARKITASEHPLKVTETVLKHAAEETRHAYYLKRQIKKITPDTCPSFEPEFLLNGRKSANYMQRLDSRICKRLRLENGLEGYELKYAAYVLVTYAVEIRADYIYNRYQEILTTLKSPISVRGILAEEEQHLAEMEAMIDQCFIHDGDKWRQIAQETEESLYQDWLSGFIAALSPLKKVA